MDITRRNFIKSIAGTIITLSLPTIPVALLSKDTCKSKKVEFTLERIEITSNFGFGRILRGLAIPKKEQFRPAYFAVRYGELDDKDELIKEVKYMVEQYYLEKYPKTAV